MASVLLTFSREEPEEEELSCECKQAAVFPVLPFISKVWLWSAWLARVGVSPRSLESVVEELLQAVGGLEDLGDVAVQLADHLVDGLLPRWVCVLSSHDGVEELSKSHLGHLQEPVRNL